MEIYTRRISRLRMNQAKDLAIQIYRYLYIHNPNRISDIIHKYSEVSGIDIEYINGISAIRGLLYFQGYTKDQLLTGSF